MPPPACSWRSRRTDGTFDPEGNGALRLDEVCEGSGGTVGLGSGIEIKGLTADSRAVEPGFLFAALPGTRAHGREFIPEALRRGAVAILADPETTLPRSEGVVLVTDPNPRRRLALMAAVFYRAQPRTIAAVTGTSGKTSTADFTRQIWAALRHKAASLGTLGLIAPGHDEYLPLTTLDPVGLHQRLDALGRAGIDHLAIEASSHGLDQYRLDGVRISAAAFTNISHEHLDYHGSMETYLAAKKRLFAELLPAGAPAVLNADAAQYRELEQLVRARGCPLLSYGRSGSALCLERQEAAPAGQELTIRLEGTRHDILFPVPGAFQAMNALAALGLVIATGGDPARAAPALGELKGVRGRIEHVATHPNGARIYVDYAHKPDALETVLTALRPHVTGRLVVVFGCGGDRDRAKRPLMGAIATRLADRVIVTDDNPRSEDPAAIRQEILKAASDAVEIGDRGEAIHAAVGRLTAGDILIIAGKGHETGQIVGSKTLPFDDAEVARAAVASIRGGAA
jgi:UDP-N-acetylmuramoyl-L-alanyl-D-glutamate--2,6-diaminopimelate ligase